MARFLTANQIINRAAVGVGLLSVSDPVGDGGQQSVQMLELLNTAGQTLVEMDDWQTLKGEIQIVVKEGDTGCYDLPADYSRLVNQTGWDHTNSVPISGPLNEQNVAYLQGRDLVSDSLYNSYYIKNNQLCVFPQPPTIGQDLRWQYIRRNWVQAAGGGEFRDEVQVGTDIVYYEPAMIVEALKLYWRDAKGFDTTSQAAKFTSLFLARQGMDEGAPVLNAGTGGRSIPYITPYRNTTDSWPWLSG